MAASRLLSPAEASERLNNSEYTLGAWRADGYGPPWLRLRGNAVRYDEKDLEAWIDAQKVRSIAEERANGRTYNGAAETGGFR